MSNLTVSGSYADNKDLLLQQNNGFIFHLEVLTFTLHYCIRRGHIGMSRVDRSHVPTLRMSRQY